MGGVSCLKLRVRHGELPKVINISCKMHLISEVLFVILYHIRKDRSLTPPLDPPMKRYAVIVPVLKLILVFGMIYKSVNFYRKKSFSGV